MGDSDSRAETQRKGYLLDTNLTFSHGDFGAPQSTPKDFNEFESDIVKQSLPFLDSSDHETNKSDLAGLRKPSTPDHSPLGSIDDSAARDVGPCRRSFHKKSTFAPQESPG